MAITRKKVEKCSTDDFLTYLEKECDAYFEPEKYKTGILPLDEVLGGYLESGSLIELSSESGVGKSTLLLNLAKNFADLGLGTLYIDSEGSVKDSMIEGLQLSPYLSTKDHKDNLFTLVRISGYTAVEELITKALQTNKFKLIVIDSLTALVGDVYLDEKEDRKATENRVGFDALMSSRLLKKLNALKTKYNCIFFCISQTRVDLSNTFITSFKSTGGQVVKFFPDVRLFMKRKKKILDKAVLVTGDSENATIGAETTIEATKSRQGQGFIAYPMTIYFGKGVSNLAAYEVLLPLLVNSKGEPVYVKKSSVTHELHLDSGDYTTSAGRNGLLTLINNNWDEIDKLCNDYVTDYFLGKHEAMVNANYEGRDDLITEENDVKDYTADDTLDLDSEGAYIE